MTSYIDSRGWEFKVHGYGPNYKALYRKPGYLGWHGCRSLKWRKTEAEAQADLEEYARKKNMKAVEE